MTVIKWNRCLRFWPYNNKANGTILRGNLTEVLLKVSRLQLSIYSNILGVCSQIYGRGDSFTKLTRHTESMCTVSSKQPCM